MSEPGILPNPIPFGKYYLLERINVGGMAEVYKAKAFGVEGFERLLAVKKILSSIAEDEAFINMFIDEAKIAGGLNHPNIAQIFDLGKVDGSYFIALEYIGGKDLKTIFERARRIGEKVSIPRVCYTIMKVCEGLAHAHTKKDAQGKDLHIVHRDISPQNVLMSYEGEVKIIDFGIAKAQGKTSQTQVGILKGKFSYMSPEQVRGLHVDHRSDLFSLGIVLYEMLTLERLFLGESDFDTLEKIRKVEMSPPSLYNPHIPKELEDIVLKALARSPDDRYQTAYEFADALERFMRNQGYYYTNKDLAQYMKEAFSADIEFENKKGEYYRSLNLKPLEPSQHSTPSHQLKGTPVAPDDSGLSWGEEEMETQIFDRMDPEELNDADIVYSSDSTGTDDVPTVEYDRWKGDGFAFNDEPPRSARGKQPTAQLPTVEPRRAPSTTVPGVRSVQRKKKVKVPVIILVTLVAIVVGFFVMQKAMAKAELQIETEPKSVQIWINGEMVHDGDTPYKGAVPLGDTTIELKREGYVPIKLTENLEARTYRLNEALSQLEHTYSLLVKSDPPGAKIAVDGKTLQEVTPFTIKDLKPGKVALTISKDGFFSETREVDIKEGAPDDIDVRMRPEKVSLKVTSVPDRAEYAVYVQGSADKLSSGRTPDTVKDLDASKKYRVVVERRKYETWEGNFEPGYDQAPTIEANLRRMDDTEPAVASVAKVIPKKTQERAPVRKDPVVEKIEKTDPPKEEVSGTGILNIASKPVARVHIDDQDTGRYTPLMNFKIKSGKHKISLKNPDFGLDKTYYVDVSAGETKKIINKP